ncbi:hypothetical protein B0H14DRAFT_3158092 [Mycena olivaceomarginata]|nr:hypothetical protein B0H14DRAFT_3158092 [Mycena olivaceomarginata]
MAAEQGRCGCYKLPKKGRRYSPVLNRARALFVGLQIESSGWVAYHSGRTNTSWNPDERSPHQRGPKDGGGEACNVGTGLGISRGHVIRRPALLPFLDAHPSSRPKSASHRTTKQRYMSQIYGSASFKLVSMNFDDDHFDFGEVVDPVPPYPGGGPPPPYEEPPAYEPRASSAPAPAHEHTRGTQWRARTLPRGSAWEHAKYGAEENLAVIEAGQPANAGVLMRVRKACGRAKKWLGRRFRR